MSNRRRAASAGHGAFACALALWCTGCSSQASLSPDAHFSCFTNDDCTEGFRCVRSACLPTADAIDAGGSGGGSAGGEGGGFGGGTGGGAGGGGGGAVMTFDAGTDAGTDAGAGADAGNDAGVDAGRPIVATLDGGPVTQTCSSDGWCWANPKTFGFLWCQVSMTSGGVAFALLGNQLYRVSSGRLEHVALDGLGTPYDVLALGADRGMVSLTDVGEVAQFTLGQPVVSQAVNADLDLWQLAVTQDGAIWATGQSVAKFDPATRSWVALSLPPTFNMSMAAMTSSTEGYVSMYDQTGSHLFSFSDGGWTGLSDAGIDWLWGDGPGRVYATTAGGIWPLAPGGLLAPLPVAPGRDYAWGANGSEVFAAGRRGISRYTLGAWQKVVDLQPVRFDGVTDFSMVDGQGIACGPNQLYVSGDAGASWRNVIDVVADPVELENASGVFVRDDGSAYVTNARATWLFDGGSASKVPALGAGTRPMAQLGPDDFLVAVSPGVHRFDGTQLGPEMPSVFDAGLLRANALAVESASTAWAVGAIGNTGVVAYWDGGVWDLVTPPVPSGSLSMVAAAGGRLWVPVADHVYLREGGQWSDLGATGFTTSTGTLRSFAAVSATEVFACAQAGINRWVLDGGWSNEVTLGCRTVAADPSAGTVLATDGAQLLTRLGPGVWVPVALPSTEAPPERLGIRGTRAWVTSRNGWVFLRP